MLRAQIVAVEVHHAFAVADEIDRVAVPHGEEVHACGLGQLFVGIFLEVVNGDGQAPAAAIALPGAEFLRSFEISDLGAVGRKRGEAGARNGKRFCGAPLRRDEEQLGVAARRRAEAVGAEEDIFAVGSPAEDDVIRRMKRQALGLAAFGGDDVHVGVAVIFTGEGDPFAVGREFRVELVTHVGG